MFKKTTYFINPQTEIQLLLTANFVCLPFGSGQEVCWKQLTAAAQNNTDEGNEIKPKQ